MPAAKVRGQTWSYFKSLLDACHELGIKQVRFPDLDLTVKVPDDSYNADFGVSDSSLREYAHVLRAKPRFTVYCDGNAKEVINDLYTNNIGGIYAETSAIPDVKSYHADDVNDTNLDAIRPYLHFILMNDAIHGPLSYAYDACRYFDSRGNLFYQLGSTVERVVKPAVSTVVATNDRSIFRVAIGHPVYLTVEGEYYELFALPMGRFKLVHRGVAYTASASFVRDFFFLLEAFGICTGAVNYRHTAVTDSAVDYDMLASLNLYDRNIDAFVLPITLNGDKFNLGIRVSVKQLVSDMYDKFAVTDKLSLNGVILYEESYAEGGACAIYAYLHCLMASDRGADICSSLIYLLDDMTRHYREPDGLYTFDLDNITLTGETGLVQNPDLSAYEGCILYCKLKDRKHYICIYVENAEAHVYADALDVRHMGDVVKVESIRPVGFKVRLK